LSFDADGYGEIDMLLKFTADEALGNTRPNPLNRWGPPLDQPDRALDPNWASTRLKENVFKTHINPSFTIRRGDLIHASGSCFAQNIELNLLKSGMNLLYSPDFFDSNVEFADLPANVRRTTLTMYNTPSIMRFTHLARVSEIDDRLCYEVKPGQFLDCTIGGLPPRPKEVLMSRRRKVREQLKRLPECTCVIFTLGLSEAWFDAEADDYLNYLPDVRLIRNQPERFQLHVLDFQQTYDQLAQGVDVLHGMGVRNIVFTISPVPLIATFTRQDIIVANEYSKSVLHAAAQTICAQKGCDYFPSYEMIRYAPAEAAWEHDRRHPSSNIVGQVTRLFAQSYIEGF
jgi:hypothetical protein